VIPPAGPVVIRRSEPPPKQRESRPPIGDDPIAIAQRAKEAVLAQRARDAALARRVKEATTAQKEKAQEKAQEKVQEKARPAPGPDYGRRTYQLIVYIAVLLTVFVAARLLGLEPAPWLPIHGIRP
jgi:hypothetical protein